MATDEAAIKIIRTLPFASGDDLAHVLAGAVQTDVGPLVRGLAGSGDAEDTKLLVETLVHFAVMGDVEREEKEKEKEKEAAPRPSIADAPLSTAATRPHTAAPPAAAASAQEQVRIDQMIEVQHLMSSLLARYKTLQRDFEQLTFVCEAKDQRIAQLEATVQGLKEERRALRSGERGAANARDPPPVAPQNEKRPRSSRSPPRRWSEPRDTTPTRQVARVNSFRSRSKSGTPKSREKDASTGKRVAPPRPRSISPAARDTTASTHAATDRDPAPRARRATASERDTANTKDGSGSTAATTAAAPLANAASPVPTAAPVVREVKEKSITETELRERALLESVSLLHQDSDVCSQDVWMFRHNAPAHHAAHSSGGAPAGGPAVTASVSPARRHHSRSSPALQSLPKASPPPQFAHVSNQRNRGGYQHVLYPTKRLSFTPPRANAAGLITRSPSRSDPPAAVAGAAAAAMRQQ